MFTSFIERFRAAAVLAFGGLALLSAVHAQEVSPAANCLTVRVDLGIRNTSTGVP